MKQERIIQKIKETPFGEGVKVLENLYLFRLPKVHFREGQAYALVQDDGLILIDAVYPQTKAAVDNLLRKYKPKAMIITHRDVLHQAFGTVSEISKWLGGITVYAHKADHERQKMRDIMEPSHLLNDSGILITPIPGHTPGSIVIYCTKEEMLFAGDSAAGARYDSDDNTFTHPTIPLGSWLDFKRGWQNVDGEVKHLLPLHGKPGFYLHNFESIRRELVRPENLME